MANVVGQDENISETDDSFFVELQKSNRYSCKQLGDITSAFAEKLGYGSFGDVYKGILDDGKKVAVKVLKSTTPSLLDDKIKDQFKAEVSTLCKTNHRNLVKLYGFCYDSDKKALVYEFMENGSLDNIKYKNQSLNWEMLWNIAIGTASGLSYLHQDCQPSIIHYDIKPSNILLDSEFSPKIGDFGLAKLLNSNKPHVTVSGFRGTHKYAAPELSDPRFDFKTTHKSDVYSYGKFLLDLISRRYCGHDEASFVQTFVNGQEGEIMKNYGIEKQNIEKAKKIVELAVWCTDYFPYERPSMRDVLVNLESPVSLPIIKKQVATPEIKESETKIDTGIPTYGLEDELEKEIRKPPGEKNKDERIFFKFGWIAILTLLLFLFSVFSCDLVMRVFVGISLFEIL